MIIGLVGNKGAGKDTFAKMLFDEFNMPIIFEAFANPIKDALCEMFQVSLWHLEKTKRNDDNLVEEIDVSTRRLLQTLGHEWGNEMIDPEIWVKLMARRVKGYDKHSVIITDVRYPHEARWIKEQPDSFLIRISRNEADEKVDQHASEKVVNAIADVDYLVYNNGTLVDLQKEAEKVAKSIMSKISD